MICTFLFYHTVLRTLVCLGNRKKKKPHIVRQHDMGGYACPCEWGFSAVINLFHPYCTML